MGRPVIPAFLTLLLTLVLSHSSKGRINVAKQIEVTKQSDEIQTSAMENSVFRATRDAKRKLYRRKKGSKQSKRSPDKERKKSGKAKKVTRKNNKNIERKRKKMMKLKGKEKKRKKKVRKTKKKVTEKKKKSKTKKNRPKKGKNKKKSGQKKKSTHNKKKRRKTRKKLGQENIEKNELSKWNPKQACDEAALYQKIKDYIKISNQLRKIRRIVKSCDTMDKKDKKSATEFEATVTALETAIGSSSGRRRTYRSRLRRAVESSDDVTSIKDKLKNCSISAKAKCQKSSVAPCQEEANLTKCETELQGWLKKFGPSKGSCLQASSDCCACITALPDVSKNCLAFDQKSILAVTSKKKCTSGEEQGSFGFCRKLQVEAAEKGPKHAKNNCPPLGPGSMTTKDPSHYSVNCTNPGYSPCNLTKGGTHNGYCCPSPAVGFGYCLPAKKNCPMAPEVTFPPGGPLFADRRPFVCDIGMCFYVKINPNIIQSVCNTSILPSTFKFNEKLFSYKGKVPPRSSLFESAEGIQGIFTCSNGKSLYGSISIEDALGEPGSSYIEPHSNDDHILVSLPHGDLHEEEEVIPDPAKKHATSDRNAKLLQRGASNSRTTARYSIKFYYTPQFAATFPDIARIDNFIDLALAIVNQGYINSKVKMEAYSLCKEQAPLKDPDTTKNLLNNFRNMKTSVSELRGGADVAALLVHKFTNPKKCGRAGVNTLNTGLTVSVTKKSCIYSYTLGHEIGHNVGLNHSDGYCFQGGTSSSGWRTIMAYKKAGCKRRVNYYSNPDVKYPWTNTPTGVVGHDSAAILNGNRFVLESIENGNKCDLPLPVIALIGGYNSHSKNMGTSDIISSDGVCSQSLPLLPEALYGAQSVYFNNTLIVCGGDRANLNYIKQCHQLRDLYAPWTVGPSMKTARRYFSMTRAGQDLYALGGEGEGGKGPQSLSHGPRLDSMEKLSSGVWTTMGEKLTTPRSAHCTLFMETTRSLIIIGGYPATNLVEEFKISTPPTTTSWTQLADLPVKLYAHGCIQLGQTILVTGGHTATDLQNKVYTFSGLLTGGNWQVTGTLQVAREFHSMGTFDNQVLVLGGRKKDFVYYDSIENKKPDGNFKLINFPDWKLNKKKAYSTAVQVPRLMNPC